MNFTDIFVRRPVLATVVSLMILVLGLRSVATLPILQYPRTENAVVTVTTQYFGADPETVAGFVTTPLENAIAQANGIDYFDLDEPDRNEHDHREFEAQLRFRQGVDGNQYEDQLRHQPVAAGRPTACHYGQSRTNDRRPIFRLWQRRSHAEPSHRLLDPRGAAASAVGSGRADRRDHRRQDLRAQSLARSGKARRLQHLRDANCRSLSRATITSPASAPPRAKWSK